MCVFAAWGGGGGGGGVGQEEGFGKGTMVAMEMQKVWMEWEEHLHAELVFCLGKSSTCGWSLKRQWPTPCRQQNTSSIVPRKKNNFPLTLTKKVFLHYYCLKLEKKHNKTPLLTRYFFQTLKLCPQKTVVLKTLFRRQKAHWVPGRSHSQATGT